MPTNNFKVGEMLNRRTPNSKTWINFDGSFTTEIHSGIVHYQDENGNLQNINTDLYDEADFDQIDFPVAKDGDSLFYEAQVRAVSDKKKNRLDREKFDFQGLKVPFDCKIPRNIKRGYSIGKGKSKLSFIPVGASSSKGYVEGNKITYPNVWPDTDVVLEMLPTGIKETIILKTNKAPFYFSFEVQGNLEGEMKIEPPWLLDAEGTKRDVVQGVSEVDGKILLNLAADVTGLVYPIEVDPTVTISGSGLIIDTFIDQQSPNLTYSYDSYMFLRKYVIYAQDRQILIKFDLSSIPNGAQIQKSEVNLYIDGTVSSGNPGLIMYVDSKRMTTDINAGSNWTNSSGKVSNSYATTPLSLDNYVGYMNFDVTGIIGDYVAGLYPNYGINLSPNAINSNISGYGGYANVISNDYADVSRRPYLSVTYNQPPTAPTVTAPNGGETWNSLETITWDAATDQDDPSSLAQIFNNTNDGNDYFYNAGEVASQSFTIDKDYGYITAVSMTMTGTGKFKVYLTNAVNDQPGSTIYAQSQEITITANSNTTLVQVPLLKFPIGTKLCIKTVFISGDVNSLGPRRNSNGSYSGGKYYLAGTLKTGVTVFSVYFTENTPQNMLQYQIQLSTDNGGNWKNIVALTNPGVTSYPYDFINEAESSLCLVRIRAYDGSAYGPWDQSDGVFTIVHNQAPTAPTNLNPNGITIDRAEGQRFSWKYNDPNSNDSQSKFDLQWRLQGAMTWNDVTQVTINEFWDFVANTFPRGTIEWRVRTYDQAGLSSPYSNIATFLAGDKPAMPTIVLPGSTVAVANPAVQWSSDGQTGFLLTVKNSSGTTVFSKERTSTNKAETITYSLENQQNYTIELKIKNADGLYSDPAVLNISVSYTPPAIPDIETVKGNSFVQINITDPIPTGTQPTVLYHEIYKEIDKEFVLIATNIKNEYKDYNVANREVTRYFVRTIGDNDTFSDTITFSESISFSGVWLHVVENPESSVYQFKLDGEGRNSKWGIESAVHHFQGRKRPVIETGEMEEFTVDFSLQILDDAELFALENIVYSQETVCYRDGRGRKAFGVFVDVPLNDEMWKGYSTSLSLMKIDFKEGIE